MPSLRDPAGLRPVLRIEGGATIYRLPIDVPARGSEPKQDGRIRPARRAGMVATLGLVYAAVYFCAFLLVGGVA